MLGDVIRPPDVTSVVIPRTAGWDQPSTVAEQVGWMEEAGLTVTVLWQEDDLALFSADRPAGVTVGASPASDGAPSGRRGPVPAH